MAETNGYAQLIVGGVKYPLLFGRAAVQEMSTRSLGQLSGNAIKILTDLVYAGRLNYAIANDVPIPSYPETYELIEKFAEEENATEQEKVLWETFEASRWGAQWKEKLEEMKKKVDEEMANLDEKLESLVKA